MGLANLYASVLAGQRIRSQDTRICRRRRGRAGSAGYTGVEVLNIFQSFE